MLSQDMSLCVYKDVFGRPGEGAHSIRVGGIALVDLGLTIGVAWLLARAYKVPMWKVFSALLCLGILVHRLFCVNTALNQAIFGRV